MAHQQGTTENINIIIPNVDAPGHKGKSTNLFGKIRVYISNLMEDSSGITGYRSKSVVRDMSGKETLSKSLDIRLTEEFMTF